jgi:hypothetical protein
VRRVRLPLRPHHPAQLAQADRPQGRGNTVRVQPVSATGSRSIEFLQGVQMVTRSQSYDHCFYNYNPTPSSKF